MPNGADVAAFLGAADDTATVALAEQTVPIVSAMARAYTRDQGWTDDGPADDLAAVITTASARAVTNPGGAEQTVGSVREAGGFTGWTLAELFVLNRYRKRAL